MAVRLYTVHADGTRQLVDDNLYWFEEEHILDRDDLARRGFHLEMVDDEASATAPDFDQIARAMARGLIVLNVVADQDRARDAFAKDLAEQLRLVWNARGAADIATIENGLPEVWTAAPVGVLTRVLRRLDR